ncbi:hypothetical protein F3Y22_tig00111783pilonHSYRG00558 [Hibiscus syriacus]|uniref:Uncharacterized protein n=1 Tax=Hibiscus syriacus TaxID=106335 RepID=A0A6A2YGS7_HIBSY|nr:hypothetical protein F3Y22_tig00111783pilonHSYRG00558 [Hibiscus syriacus]
MSHGMAKLWPKDWNILKHTQNDTNEEHVTINSRLCVDLPTHGISAPSTCNLTAQHHLSRIPLHHKLSDKVPEGFSNLVDLQYLNLSSNGFTGRIPSNYGLLQSLIVLSVSFNRVSGMIPSELGSCSNLEVLQLRSNHLRGNILRDISRYLI